MSESELQQLMRVHIYLFLSELAKSVEPIPDAVEIVDTDQGEVVLQIRRSAPAKHSSGKK